MVPSWVSSMPALEEAAPCSLKSSSASGVWLPALSSADSALLPVNTLHEAALGLPSGHSGLPSALSASVPAAFQHHQQPLLQRGHMQVMPENHFRN